MNNNEKTGLTPLELKKMEKDILTLFIKWKNEKIPSSMALGVCLSLTMKAMVALAPTKKDLINITGFAFKEASSNFTEEEEED